MHNKKHLPIPTLTNSHKQRTNTHHTCQQQLHSPLAATAFVVLPCRHQRLLAAPAAAAAAAVAPNVGYGPQDKHRSPGRESGGRMMQRRNGSTLPSNGGGGGGRCCTTTASPPPAAATINPFKDDKYLSIGGPSPNPAMGAGARSFTVVRRRGLAAPPPRVAATTRQDLRCGCN
jgi:hypothetical protein